MISFILTNESRDRQISDDFGFINHSLPATELFEKNSGPNDHVTLPVQARDWPQFTEWSELRKIVF